MFAGIFAMFPATSPNPHAQTTRKTRRHEGSASAAAACPEAHHYKKNIDSR